MDSSFQFDNVMDEKKECEVPLLNRPNNNRILRDR